MQDNTPQVLTGQQLTADFQNAFVTIATTSAAKQEAKLSEEALVSQLSSISNGSFLNPANLGDDMQTAITRESLDAHIKKVQAQQLDSLSAQQLENLSQQDTATYVGRKIRVTVLDKTKLPIEFVWFNQHTGYRNNTSRKLTVVGTIQEVRLDENILLLKPPVVSQIFSRDLQHYLVYIIDPETLTPLVELTLI